MENFNIQPSYFINKYGISVKIQNKNEIKETKAFVQPLKYRQSIYLSKTDKQLLENAERNGYKLYIGRIDIPLSTSDFVFIENQRYRVMNTEEQTIKGKPVYTWAILEPIN